MSDGAAANKNRSQHRNGGKRAKPPEEATFGGGGADSACLVQPLNGTLNTDVMILARYGVTPRPALAGAGNERP